MNEVIDRINELFFATDERAWARVWACFTPQVMFDMSSLSGQPAERKSSDAIVAMWESGLAELEAIHHQAGNYRVQVKGSEATAFCYGIALHYKKTKSGRNTRTFVGSYDFHLVNHDGAWLIDEFRFNLKFIDGNVSLEDD